MKKKKITTQESLRFLCLSCVNANELFDDIIFLQSAEISYLANKPQNKKPRCGVIRTWQGRVNDRYIHLNKKKTFFISL